MKRVKLWIRVERKNGARVMQLQIDKTELTLFNNERDVMATPGRQYWLFIVIEGRAGASVELTVQMENGPQLLKVPHSVMSVPPRLGRNAGIFSFNVP